MKPAVHILAYVRKPELLDAALLVFRSLRTGFPTAPVKVWGNALDSRSAALIERAASQAGASFQPLPATTHDAWIEALIEENMEPFWVCDTDILFWGPVEDWPVPPIFAGRFEPEFDEEWTGTRHLARLHTCLMMLNPGAMRTAMREWAARIPMPWRAVANFPFIRQQFAPLAGCRPIFYDTGAGLYQAAGGTAFTDEQNAAFDHLHCATYADLVKAPSLSTLQDAHRCVYSNSEVARGMQNRQNEYYARRALRPLSDQLEVNNAI